MGKARRSRRRGAGQLDGPVDGWFIYRTSELEGVLKREVRELEQEGLAFLARNVERIELDGEPGFGTITGIYGLDSLPVRFTRA